MALFKPAKDLKIFSCPLCEETLKSPKILPCLHTFCEKCICEYIVTLERRKDDKLTYFSCPLCRTVVRPEKADAEPPQWTSSLQTNNAIQAMMAVTSDGKNNEKECDACRRHNQKEVNVAKFWCKECIEAMCEDCLTKHNWVKFSGLHRVTDFTEFAKSTNGVDLNVIQETCPKHTNKPVESYCMDHGELCCLSCVVLDHRGCKEIKTVDNLTDTETIKEKQQTLIKLKDEATLLLESKKDELQYFESEASKTEETAAKCVKTLKYTLDQLFETFVKELNVYRDEKSTDIEVRIRLLQQLISGLEHWITTTEVVKESGSKAQLLIYLETIKNQLNVSVSELIKACEKDAKIDIKFDKEETLKVVETVERIGVFSIDEKKLSGECGKIMKFATAFGSKGPPTFDTLMVTKITTIHRPKSDFRCGVCIGEKYLVIGDNRVNSGQIRSLHVLNRYDGAIISTTEFFHIDYVKRLSYDDQQKYIFISCCSCGLFRAGFSDQTIQKPLNLTFNKDYVGALLCYHGNMYVVVHGAIKSFPVTADPLVQFKMKICFNTNVTSQYTPVTSASGFNALCQQNGELIYTTKDKEIKRAAFDGREIFTYKDDVLKTPECITVLPSGLILVCDRDRNGSLHLLSADGKQRKTLLDKFENITNPYDIWLDANGETLYIAGGEFIEIYQISWHLSIAR